MRPAGRTSSILRLLLGASVALAAGCAGFPAENNSPPKLPLGVIIEAGLRGAIKVSNVSASYTSDKRLLAKLNLINTSRKAYLVHLQVFFQDINGNILNADAEKQLYVLGPKKMAPYEESTFSYDATAFTVHVTKAESQ